MIGANDVGGVDRAMAGCLALLRGVMFVVQPSSTIFMRQSVLGVPPPSDDGGAFEGDFATVPLEEYLTPGIA